MTASDVTGSEPASPTATSVLLSPLHDRHVALGAKLGDFGGWSMPLEYADGGVVAEHTAVREGVGVFDVSHLGKAAVRGPGALAFVNSVLTNDVTRIGPSQAQYTLLCNDSGGVIDDLIAYVFSDEHVFLIPNASNNAEVVAVLRAAAPSGVEVTNEHQTYAILAVQGPRSAELVGRLGLPNEMAYMSFAEFTVAGGTVSVCRTGYTGEHGYELVVPWSDATTWWDALMTAGADLDVRACGLGSRDTLRTEMGYPLHGQDLSVDISPVRAGAAWAVGWDKPAFHGREALLRERSDGPAQRSRGLLALDRGIPRAHMHVLAADGGTVIGQVTSGTFSPTLKQGIALALINTSSGVVIGAEVLVDVRGKPSRFLVVKPPFVDRSTR